MFTRARWTGTMRVSDLALEFALMNHTAGLISWDGGSDHYDGDDLLFNDPPHVAVTVHEDRISDEIVIRTCGHVGRVMMRVDRYAYGESAALEVVSLLEQQLDHRMHSNSHHISRDDQRLMARYDSAPELGC